jgi:hypothetical protein
MAHLREGLRHALIRVSLRGDEVFNNLRGSSPAEGEVALDLARFEAAAELAAVRVEEPLHEREIAGDDGLHDRHHVVLAEDDMFAGLGEELRLVVSEEFQRVDRLVLAAEVQRV